MCRLRIRLLAVSRPLLQLLIRASSRKVCAERRVTLRSAPRCVPARPVKWPGLTTPHITAASSTAVGHSCAHGSAVVRARGLRASGGLGMPTMALRLTFHTTSVYSCSTHCRRAGPSQVIGESCGCSAFQSHPSRVPVSKLWRTHQALVLGSTVY